MVLGAHVLNALAFNPDSKSCTAMDYANGPDEAHHNSEGSNGTYGRFRYVPQLDSFVLINDWNQDSYLLKIR